MKFSCSRWFLLNGIYFVSLTRAQTHVEKRIKQQIMFYISAYQIRFLTMSGTNFPKYCLCIYISDCVHAIVCLPLLSHPHSQVLWGSAWQCKPDLGPSVSTGMNNSPCSGWCGLQMADTLEQTAGLPLMSLFRLSQIVVVLNHLFRPPQSARAHSLLVAKRLNSVTAQRHLLIKTKTQLHQYKRLKCRDVLHLSASCWCVNAAGELENSLLSKLSMLQLIHAWTTFTHKIILLSKYDKFVLLLFFSVCCVSLVCILHWYKNIFSSYHQSLHTEISLQNNLFKQFMVND